MKKIRMYRYLVNFSYWHQEQEKNGWQRFQCAKKKISYAEACTLCKQIVHRQEGKKDWDKIKILFLYETPIP